MVSMVRQGWLVWNCGVVLDVWVVVVAVVGISPVLWWRLVRDHVASVVVVVVQPSVVP